MKRIFIAISFLVSLNTQAQFPNASINNFTGNYKEPSGTATADSFSIGEINFGHDTKFTVEKQAGLIHLRAGSEEFTIENPPEFIQNLETLNWRGIVFNSSTHKISAQIPSFDGNGAEGRVAIQNLNISCDHSQRIQNNLKEELLDSCLNHKATFAIGSLYFNENKATNLSNLSVSTKSNDLNFSVRAGVNVKGHGKIWYDENAQTIKVRIDSARAGILNVYSRFFNELRALESENISVNAPWIEIQL